MWCSTRILLLLFLPSETSHIKSVLITDGTNWHDNWGSYATPYDILHSAISRQTLTAIHPALLRVPFSTLPETSLCFCKFLQHHSKFCLGIQNDIPARGWNGNIEGHELGFLYFESVWYHGKSFVCYIVLLFKKILLLLLPVKLTFTWHYVCSTHPSGFYRLPELLLIWSGLAKIRVLFHNLNKEQLFFSQCQNASLQVNIQGFQ
jgi:hypothetical protein